MLKHNNKQKPERKFRFFYVINFIENNIIFRRNISLVEKNSIVFALCPVGTLVLWKWQTSLIKRS